MNWQERIIDDHELGPFFPERATPEFRSRAQALLAQQLLTWPMLRDGVEGLAQAQYKRLAVKGSEVLCQYNPKRMVSTAAQVDAASIEQRPCFLCLENLPLAEKGIAFGDDFVTLCNPFPVLRNHLVIAARRHTPQTIEGNFGALLDLAVEFGADWFTLYNGPRCGASAPDHLHFQACAREMPPALREIESWDRRLIRQTEAIEVFTLSNYRLNMLIARSGDRLALTDWVETVMRRLAELTGEAAEPMINLVVICDRGKWTVIVYPRDKHRPSCYYLAGAARLIVSPAAIDLSGVLVVPRPDHFARITADDVEKIYAEVTLDDARFKHL
jgi:hypothetical protein